MEYFNTFYIFLRKRYIGKLYEEHCYTKESMESVINEILLWYHTSYDTAYDKPCFSPQSVVSTSLLLPRKS